MQPANNGDNPAAPASRITPSSASRVPSAAFESVHALARAVDAYAATGLPTQAECPEYRAVISAAHAVGDDLRESFVRALDGVASDVDAARDELDAARERLENAIRAQRETRLAVRRAEREGSVPAVGALGDNNTRRWHPVDGWQDGNEAPEVNSPMALDAALADAEAFAGGDVASREVTRAAALALDGEDERGA
jgi:hypothetical protein